jgi:hypothetical protein
MALLPALPQRVQDAYEIAMMREATRGGVTIVKPDGHPYPRLTRDLAPATVVTIEAGIYFIDRLLDELKENGLGLSVDWNRVAQFRPFGGIRIESDGPLCGEVRGPEPIRYEVSGPFGSGYSIRVMGMSGSGSLRFLRDYAGAEVVTPSGRYDMSAESAYGADGRKAIALGDDGIVTDSTDVLLLALFAVNHHFWHGTGPFAKERVP